MRSAEKLLLDRLATLTGIELVRPRERARHLAVVVDDDPGTALVDHLRHRAHRVAVTGVPHAIDSIMTGPNGSSHSIGKRVARAF